MPTKGTRASSLQTRLYKIVFLEHIIGMATCEHRGSRIEGGTRRYRYADTWHKHCTKVSNTSGLAILENEACIELDFETCHLYSAVRSR